MRAHLLPFAVAIALATAAGARGEPFGCPATLETVDPAGGPPQFHKFRYVSFYDGDPSEMANLAPEEGPNPKVVEQRWQLTRTPGRPIVMVCRYHGTDQTVRREVPPEIKECRLEGFIDENAEIVGSPTLICR